MIAVDEHTIREDVRQWSGLVLTGAWVALASVALIVVQVVIFLVWPTPRSTRGLFEMLLENPLRGLLALDLLYVVSNLLAYLLYFALAVVLFRVSRSAVVVALAFGVLGMAAYMASPRPVEMLLLARSYAKADAAEQVALLATGEGMLATWTGTAFDVYYLFNLVTLLVMAVLMCRSQVFSRPTALLGIGGCSAHGRPVELRDGWHHLRAGLTRSVGRVCGASRSPTVRPCRRCSFT